jgi:hypothetical protein
MGSADMVRFFAAVLLGGLAASSNCQFLAAQTLAAPTTPVAATGQPSGAKSEDAVSNIGHLPPVPPGKSTIIGGEIRRVDPVRDVLVLRIFGQKTLKILFDERTQVFVDGKKIPLRDLRPADHASVQTILDGTNIFAVSIHMLSTSPEGDYQGRILSYDPDTTELTISSAMSHQPMRLLVPANTLIARQGQTAFTAGQRGSSDLMTGSLISVKFESDKFGRGVASQIAILATPGAEFTFIGDLSSLDVETGSLVLVDPRDDKRYQISFSPGMPISRRLHVGNQIMVTATFDGGLYVAKTIAIE